MENLVAVTYSRFSSIGQNSQTIKTQQEMCHVWASKHGYTILRDYVDEATSGTSMSARHQFRQLLDDSKHGEFSAVIVMDSSRFARSTIDSLLAREELSKNGVKVISVTENFDEETPEGKLMLGIISAINQHSSDALSRRVINGQRAAMERAKATGRGIHMGGVAPLGYRIENRHYEIDPVTAPIVKQIFEQFAKGRSEVEICKQLNSAGFKTGRGQPFTKSSLQNLLRNPRVTGLYKYGDTEIKGGMPRLISDEIYAKVQRRIAKQRNAPRSNRSYLLTTKIYCAVCDEWLVGTSARGKMGTLYFYYSCKQAISKNKQCDVKYLNGNVLEEAVIEACREMLTDKRIAEIIEAISALSQKLSNNPYIAQLKNEIAKTETSIENLLTTIEGGGASDIITERLATRESELHNFKMQLKKEEDSLEILTEAQIRPFLEGLREGSIDSKKYREMLVSVFVNKIYLQGDELTIFFNVSEREPAEITKKLREEVKMQVDGCSNNPAMAEDEGFEPSIRL